MKDRPDFKKNSMFTTQFEAVPGDMRFGDRLLKIEDAEQAFDEWYKQHEKEIKKAYCQGFKDGLFKDGLSESVTVLK